jgi:hypothetical protein
MRSVCRTRSSIRSRPLAIRPSRSASGGHGSIWSTWDSLKRPSHGLTIINERGRQAARNSEEIRPPRADWRTSRSAASPCCVLCASSTRLAAKRRCTSTATEARSSTSWLMTGSSTTPRPCTASRMATSIRRTNRSGRVGFRAAERSSSACVNSASRFAAAATAVLAQTAPRRVGRYSPRSLAQSEKLRGLMSRSATTNSRLRPSCDQRSSRPSRAATGGRRWARSSSPAPTTSRTAAESMV